MREVESLKIEVEGTQERLVLDKNASDVRVRVLTDEVEKLRALADTANVKIKRTEQQLKLSEEDSLEKENRNVLSRQQLTALQLQCDKGETDILVIKSQIKTDASENRRVIESLEAQLQSVRAAKATVESLLLSSGDEDDSAHTDLINQIKQLQGVLDNERNNSLKKDSLLSGYEEEKNQLLMKVKEMSALESTIKKLETELVTCRAQLASHGNELITLKNEVKSSEKSERNEVTKLQDQSATLTSDNLSLTTVVQRQADDVRTLQATVSQLQMKLSQSEQQLKLSVEDLSRMSEQLDSRGKGKGTASGSASGSGRESGAGSGRDSNRESSSNVDTQRQLEAERDQYKSTATALEEKIQTMEARTARLEAKIAMSKLPVTPRLSVSGPGSLDNSSNISILNARIDQLTADNSSLAEKNITVIEQNKSQSEMLNALNSKHRLSILEINSMELQLSATNTERENEREMIKTLLQQQMNAERVQHQQALNSLHDIIKLRDTEISKLRTEQSDGNKVRGVGGVVQDDVSGIKALSVIVGQQQSSVQRLEEKLMSAEGLIHALSQSIPSQKVSGTDKKVKKLKGRKEGGTDTGGSEGESERKSAAANTIRNDITTSPNRNRDREKEKEKEKEKEQRRNEEKNIEVEVASPYWQSSSDNESDVPATKGARTYGKVDHNTNLSESWSKAQRGDDQIPSRTWTTAATAKPQRQKEKDRQRDKEQVQGGGGGGGGGAGLELEIWALKIAREDRFLGDLTATLKDEKLSVRKEQEALGKRRSAWRVKKAQNPKDLNSRSELREASNDLNAQTTRLNSAVEQTRVMHGFLTERRRKLNALKEYLHQLSKAKETRQSGRARDETPVAPHRDQDDEAELTLENMEQLGRELDSEVEVTLLEFGYGSSSADDTRTKINITPPQGSGFESHPRYQPRRSSPSQHDRPYKQNIYQQQQQQQPQQQRPALYQQHPAPNGPLYYPQPHPADRGQYNDPRSDLFGYDNRPHPRSEYVDQNDGYNNNQHPGYYPSSSTMLSPARRAQSSSSMREDPLRWAQTASAVRFNLSSKGIVEEEILYDRTAPIRDPRIVRGELKDLTNRRAQTTQAFDTHARYCKYRSTI